MNKDSEGPLLKFSTVEIHFIYSFFMDVGDSFADFKECLTNNDPNSGWFSTEKPKKPCQRIGVPANLRIRKPHINKKNGELEHYSELYSLKRFDSPLKFTGIPKRFDCDLNSKNSNDELIINPLEKFSDYDGINDLGTGQRCEILTRIFNTGAGTITIKLTLDKRDLSRAVDSIDILRLFELINSSETPKIKYPLIHPQSLPKVVKWPADQNHTQVIDKNTEHSTKKGYRLIDFVINECKEIEMSVQNSYHIQSSKESSGVWLDKLIMDVDPNDDNKGMLDYQTPFVFVKGDLLEDKSFKKPWWDLDESSFSNTEGSKEDLNKLKEVNTLLLRYIKGLDLLNHSSPQFDQIKFPYKYKTTDYLLQNFSWHEHMFIGLHARASLLLVNSQKTSNMTNTAVKKEKSSSNENATDNVGRFVSESILDLLEMLRARWHISVGINELLDLDIERLKLETSEDNVVFLTTFIRRRKQFAIFLSDPLTYSFEGGLINDLYQVAVENFHLSHLRNMIFNKFNVIEGLYENTKEFIQYTHFRNSQKK